MKLHSLVWCCTSQDKASFAGVTGHPIIKGLDSKSHFLFLLVLFSGLGQGSLQSLSVFSHLDAQSIGVVLSPFSYTARKWKKRARQQKTVN